MNNATLLKNNLYLFVGAKSDFYNELLACFAQPNVFVRYLRGEKSIDLESFFDEYSAALQFPYYFGENWAAFDECLNDLRLYGEKKIILFISDTQDLLRKENEMQINNLIDILVNATLEWAAKEVLFQVVFHCEQDYLEVVHKKLSYTLDLLI